MTRPSGLDDIIRSHDTDLTFNFYLALPGRASSPHTQRAYFRWVDTYLADVAGLKPMRGDSRINRMQSLPVPVLQKTLSAPQLRAWLGRLIQRGHGKQGIDQARAAIVTLTDLVVEAGWLDDYTAAAVARVRPPRAEDGQRPGRWLSLDELRRMMRAAEDVATTRNQSLRNAVVMNTLCTMALRREELSAARWGDLSLQNNRPVLRVHGKGRKVAYIDVPRPVLRALDRWRLVIAPDALHPSPETPLVRRIWKGGRVADHSLSPDGIWLIVDQAAVHAGVGHVAPHDLRRSVAGALNESGVPVETISRLLRHSNIAVTEKYLSRLPRANEGALLMSEALGLEEDEWPGFE
ncbi:MAG: tyrosine-type recombinase/integrase [Chloroflexota bacterium]